MTITAKVICDSICKHSKIRITTLELEYPRFIHSKHDPVEFAEEISGDRAEKLADALAEHLVNNGDI